MNNELIDPAFYPFLIKKLQDRLSGSTVMSLDQTDKIKRSIEFVLANGREGSLPERFEQGKEQICKRLAELRKLYKEIKVNIQSFGIESLEGSLNEIENFLSNYDIDYGAAEVDQTFIDYQLAEPVPTDFMGIDFYERYLKNLAAEVFFLHSIPENLIYELLDNYQELIGFNYRQDVNNLFEIVFKQVIGKILIGKNRIDNLIMSRIEEQYVLVKINNQSVFPELNQIFQQGDYYKRIFGYMKEKVSNLVKETSDVHFFITYNVRKEEIELPSAMTSTEFNQFINDYSIANQQEKIQMITTKIKTPTDLEEYLNTVKENEKFYRLLFKKLKTDLMISVLLFIMKEYHSTSYDNFIEKKNYGSLLDFFKNYLASLSDEERSVLFKIADKYQLKGYDFS